MRKNSRDLFIVLYKTIVYVALYLVFFLCFKRENIALVNLSRTLVITSMTFVTVGILMMFVYGNFEIGKKKTKPIIYSMAVGIILTDLLTYLQLMIMNTNPFNNPVFKLEQLDTLLIVIVVQILIIYITTSIGNRIYFNMNKPMKTLLVCSDPDDHDAGVIERFIDRFKLQYNVVGKVHQDKILDPKCLDAIEYVVFVNVRSAERKQWVDECYKRSISFSYSPSISDVLELSGEHVTFDDKPMISIDAKGLSLEQRVVKRAIDLLGAIVGVILSSPIWIVSAIAIKLGDGGSILFTQDRYTINGKIFKVYKFRTMKENVENYSSTEDDDRITKVGKVLRKIRMDELPQLLNILKGDMSLVGPRPEMLSNVELYEQELPEFRYRLRVKAGLTGIAQIEGKYNTSPYDKLLMDLLYIENYSIWSDIKLILRTVTVIFKSDSTEGFDKPQK
ncbi:sugar transferase [Erysipelothrix sp. HDW6A]|uniref:sugar transferase n=1 Tax=Erysipelothrix sp. HDW6A TaxID=2714928 RepID=UPI001408F58B|nr:sugar transferase [Erysipelothrix sp. HDW6A]QIK56980.1 sugar transferase [Erysipelothrix sp. HDW6A]